MKDKNKSKKQHIIELDQHKKKSKELEKLRDKMSSCEEELDNSEERLKIIWLRHGRL